MALPIMKAIEFGAASQMAEPISNRATTVKKVYLMLKKVYIFPNSNKVAQWVSR
jgi:hypothetical protein